MRLCAIYFGVAMHIFPAASQPHEKKTCADLTGNYAFEGQWEKFEASGINSEKIREDVLKAPPRFDEKALSIVARQVINPRDVTLKQDLSTGALTVDILGSGVNSQLKEYGPLLPMRMELTCVNGRWLRENVAYGKGGFSSTETRNQIYLKLDTNGEMTAEGEKLIKSGLILENKLVLRWVTRFKKA